MPERLSQKDAVNAGLAVAVGIAAISVTAAAAYYYRPGQAPAGGGGGGGNGVPVVASFSFTPATGRTPLPVTVTGQLVDQLSGRPLVGFSCYVSASVFSYPPGAPTSCVSVVLPVTTDPTGNFSVTFTLDSWSGPVINQARTWSFAMSTSAVPFSGAGCAIGSGFIFFSSPTPCVVTP